MISEQSNIPENGVMWSERTTRSVEPIENVRDSINLNMKSSYSDPSVFPRINAS